jgi:phospholipase C
MSDLRSLFALAVLSSLLVPSTGGAQVLHHIAAANISVVQNDAGNTTNSVTVSTSLSINDFRIRPGSNRADYNVQIGSVSTDDVTNGILMGSIDQNGRDNGELDTFPGMNYGTCSIDSNASSSPGSSGEYWLSVFQAPSNAEYNFNVAAGWFPYSDGWYGGWLVNSNGVNGGPNNHLIGNPSLVLGTHVVDQGSGNTKVDLRAFGFDSRSNAVLIVEGAKNEANFAYSATNSDGTWTVTCHDDNGGTEQDYIAFVCIPLTNHTVVSGRFMGDASIVMQSQPYQVANTGNGTYHLSILGVNPANGVLLISAEGGGSINGDNIVSYQINGDGWDIQTRDITVGFTPELQNLDSSNAVASFVYIPGPTPGATSLRWFGTPTTNWDFSANQDWRLTNNAPTQYVDGDVTIFDDTASNFIVNLTASVSPYQLIVSNIVHDYVLAGAGSITGPSGVTKQGTGKLTLAVTNSYTGDTLISQGTLALNGSGGIPGGVGMGNVTVAGTLDLAGFNATVNHLSGSGSVDNSVAGTPQLKVFETTNSTFSGTIKNTAGAMSLVLDGGGILTLTGASTFSGGSTVSNGTLIVKGSLGGGSVTVQGNGQLGGTGTIGGPVSLAGNSSLDLTANAPLITGPITLNGVVTLNIAGGVSLTNAGTYVLLRHGARSGSGSFKLVLPPGLQANGFTASQADSGTQLQLIVTAAGVTGTIADVRHVVLLMDENRAFDHYLGTFHGVRGYNDRNAIQFTNQNSDFFQPTGVTTFELPFHNTLQCLTDLNHTWPVTHATINNGKNDSWIANKGAETMCHFQRTDLPVFYALADAYTVCDEYHCSVLASTDPNRFTFMTGMIDPNSTGGGPEIDNSSIPDGYRWRTYPEFLQDAGINWKVYCVPSDDADNVLPRFANFKQALPGTALYNRGRAGYSDVTNMINGFASDVANNTLPSVSWIIGPSDYTEHPPHSPANGQLFLKQILDALAANPQVYNSTVFIFNYDENDGFFDHAMPIIPPPGTPNEFVGSLPIGLGIRVPAIIVSPWSRGGRVCSQVFDHTSTIRFLETWTGVIDTNITAWRRQVCGDLTSALDFKHPNPDYPGLPSVTFVDCPSGSTPSVPTQQSLPTQESGSPIPMPLPYQPNASCALDSAASTVTILMTNSGSASVHFGVYANAFRADGPWPFDVNSSTNTVFSTSTTAGKYDFGCYGPNGFQRRFAGNVNSDFQKIEAVAFLNPGIAGIKIELINTSSASVTFAVTNGYTVNGLTNIVVPAHTTNVFNALSETNNGYYDITTTASADAAFVRRFLGRVETVAAPTAFVSSKNPCSPGDSVTFTFTASGYGNPGGTVQFTTNGFAAGAPVTLANGTAAFTIASFGCSNLPVSAVYSGDLLNSSTTNTLVQQVTTAPPIITLNGANPLTNWLGTPFVDPGVTALDLCGDSVPVTTNGSVNSAVAGTYQLQYVAGSPSATNNRTVLVVSEIPPTVSGAKLLPNGYFQFSYTGPTGQPYKVMTSTNLANPAGWTVVASGSFGAQATNFADSNVTSQSTRFYRLVSP